MGFKTILSVIQLIVVRWNSELKMLRRLLLLKKPLCKVLAMEHLNWKQTLTESEWHILELLEKILEPLERATEIMSGSFNPTLSMAIPVLCGIDEAITSFEKKYNDEFELPLVLRLYLLELKDSLDLRFSHMEN